MRGIWYIGESRVRRVGRKHKLSRKIGRYLCLDKEALEGCVTWTEEMVKVLSKLKAFHQVSDHKVEVSCPGELICQDLICTSYDLI